MLQVLVAHQNYQSTDIFMKTQAVCVEVNNVMFWYDIKLKKHTWIITVFMENKKIISKVSLTAFLLAVLSEGNLNEK